MPCHACLPGQAAAVLGACCTAGATTFSCPGAQVLALDGNRISQVPAAIGQLSRLESLALSDNLLTELPPALGRLPRLRQLLVSQNRLARLPDELGECGQLEELDVHHNALTVREWGRLVVGPPAGSGCVTQQQAAGWGGGSGSHCGAQVVAHHDGGH